MRHRKNPRTLRRYQQGHRVVLLRDGAETFPSMLAAIQQAKKNICLETYILRDDRTGNKFAKALIQRAGEGIEVNLMYDALGSFGINKQFLESMRQAGVRIVVYNPIFPWISLARLNRRNHRKSLIVDGYIGFVGGINIADEYAPIKEGGKGWRDTNLRIEGPAVYELQSAFLRLWTQCKGLPINFALYHKSAIKPGNVRARILSNQTFRERLIIRNAYLRAIRFADHSILITNGYFLPDPEIIRALRRAVKRGVRVQIIFGGASSDVPWVSFAGFAVYGKLIKRGVELYEWKENVLHAKTAVVDGSWSTVGSYNLDYRSLLHNLEVNAAIWHAEFAQQMEHLFAQDLQRAKRISYADWKRRPWLQRMKEQIAYMFRFLL